MTNVFIIHGVGGHPEENWFPWLKGELEKLDCNVIIPQFPTPENQTLNEWLKVLDYYKDKINQDTIFIGHSLGVPFVLNVAERCPIKAAYLVAGFTGVAGNQFDDGMKTFAQRDFKWKKIKHNCPNFYVFHSDNDPYIDLKKGEALTKNLGVDLIFVPSAGHFNEAAGYTKFDLLLEKIKEQI